MAEIDITLPRNREYTDISMTFAKNPVTFDIITLSGVDAVKRSIKNILMTQTGEVPFFPAYGSRIRHLLFEPMDPITSALLQSEILASIAAFEPRVKVLGLLLDFDEDGNRYQVQLTIRLLNQIQPIILSLFLSRLR
jgi:phage baseplate assembly protein W